MANDINKRKPVKASQVVNTYILHEQIGENMYYDMAWETADGKFWGNYFSSVGPMVVEITEPKIIELLRSSV